MVKTTTAVLITAAALLLAVNSPVSAATVACWDFEEGAPGLVAGGAGSILDSQNGLNGTPYGTDGPIYRAAPPPGGPLGLEFDGVDDRVFVPDDPLLALTGSLTLEAIVRVDGIDTSVCDINQIVVRADDRCGLDPYFLCVGEHEGVQDANFIICDGSDTDTGVGAPIVLGQWFHVAGTLDDATGLMRLYIDGEKVAEITTDVRPLGPLTGDNPGIGIGNLQCDWLDQYFDGTISVIRISDEALSPYQFLGATPIPEPLSMIFFGTGVAAVAGFVGRRRRKSRRARTLNTEH